MYLCDNFSLGCGKVAGPGLILSFVFFFFVFLVTFFIFCVFVFLLLLSVNLYFCWTEEDVVARW